MPPRPDACRRGARTRSIESRTSYQFGWRSGKTGTVLSRSGGRGEPATAYAAQLLPQTSGVLRRILRPGVGDYVPRSGSRLGSPPSVGLSVSPRVRGRVRVRPRRGGAAARIPACFASSARLGGVGDRIQVVHQDAVSGDRENVVVVQDGVAVVGLDTALYGAPSIDFVAYPYPPFYYYAAIPLTSLVGVNLLALRLVSLLATLATALIIYALVRHETRRRDLAFVSAGLFFATYRISGAYMDVARIDSLDAAFYADALGGGEGDSTESPSESGSMDEASNEGGEAIDEGPFLIGADVDIRLVLANLTYRELVASGGEIHLKGRDGSLRAEITPMALADGTLQGTADYQVAGDRMSLTWNLETERVDVTKIFMALDPGEPPSLEGLLTAKSTGQGGGVAGGHHRSRPAGAGRRFR